MLVCSASDTSGWTLVSAGRIPCSSGPTPALCVPPYPRSGGPRPQTACTPETHGTASGREGERLGQGEAKDLRALCTFSGWVNVPALHGVRGSHSLTLMSQLPVTMTLTSGQYSTHRIGASCVPTIVSIQSGGKKIQCHSHTRHHIQLDTFTWLARSIKSRRNKNASRVVWAVMATTTLMGILFS